MPQYEFFFFSSMARAWIQDGYQKHGSFSQWTGWQADAKKEKRKKARLFWTNRDKWSLFTRTYDGRCDWKFSVCMVISHRLENKYMHVDEVYEYDDSDFDLTLSKVLSQI